MTTRKFESDVDIKKRAKSRKKKNEEHMVTKEMIILLIELVNQ